MELLEGLQNQLTEFIKGSSDLSFFAKVIIAFIGGLAASLTPCVLPMLPLYLSYIGATEVKSKADAFNNALLFCLGAALVFSFMGIFASFASFIMVDYRGYIQVLIGIFIVIMALSLLEIIHLPLPQVVKSIPKSGPFVVGMAFSLISSPCASPILFAILAMSSTAGSSLNGALIMASYSVGYTGILFLVSLFGGLAKRLDFFKSNSRKVIIGSGIILGLLGAYFLYSGIMWFVG